jgi:predicted ArsR family transcriptional regulator
MAMTQQREAHVAGPGLHAPGLGGPRQLLLDLLKRGGPTAIPALAAQLALNVETVRHHLQTLTALGLVERQGTRRAGPGRPEVLYALSSGAEPLFPRREGEVLRALAEWLKRTGNESLLQQFFTDYIDARRADALARVQGLEGGERLEEVTRILSELGFMAESGADADDGHLRLCHCPLRELVEVTTAPCRAEIGFIRELMGERLSRLSYIPAGDASCSYRPADS